MLHTLPSWYEYEKVQSQSICGLTPFLKAVSPFGRVNPVKVSAPNVPPGPGALSYPTIKSKIAKLRKYDCKTCVDSEYKGPLLTYNIIFIPSRPGYGKYQRIIIWKKALRMCDQLFESEWAFSRRSQEQGPLGQRHWQPLCRDLVNPLSTNRSSYFARYTHTLFCNTHYCLPRDPAILQDTHTLFARHNIVYQQVELFRKTNSPFCKTYTRNYKTHTLFCKTLCSSITSLNNFATQRMLNTKQNCITIATLTSSVWVLYKNSWTFPQSTGRDWAVREAFAKSPQKGFGPRQSGFSYTSQKPFKSANCNILTCLRTVGQDS